MTGFSHPGARAARLIALLALLAGLVGGCQGVPSPLIPLGEDVSAESGAEGGPLVRVAACWASLPLVTELISEYERANPHAAFDVVPVPPDVARDLLATGQADVAVIGIGPDEGEGTEGLAGRAVALDAVTMIAHPGTGLTELTGGQIAALYAGEYLRWDELNGSSDAVEVVTHVPGATERAIFERALMGEKQVSSFAIVMPHDRAVIDYVATHPGAIGYVSNAYVDDRVQVFAVDGQRPTDAEVRSGRYPLGYPLVFLTPSEAIREAERWTAHALGSRGRQVVERRYTVPR